VIKPGPGRTSRTRPNSNTIPPTTNTIRRFACLHLYVIDTPLPKSTVSEKAGEHQTMILGAKTMPAVKRMPANVAARHSWNVVIAFVRAFSELALFEFGTLNSAVWRITSPRPIGWGRAPLFFIHGRCGVKRI
jgi:hypothetical protein